MHHLSRLSIISLLIVSLIIIWAIYALALPGQFLFDDPSNLSGLAEVEDALSASGYLISNQAGPLGRPITMATFLPQREAWPGHPEAMLAVNFTIHSFAVLATFILAVGLARSRLAEPASSNRSLWIGLGVAVLWGLSPFLATTHLMIIQRAASLSGLFVLTGLSAFVWAHLVAPRHPRHATLLLLLGLGIGTLLASLSKESGALLPLLALVILMFWIPRDQRPKTTHYKIIIILFVVIPTLLILGYLATLTPGIFEQGYGDIRYFTPEQRLMSQPSILMEYLRYLLLPKASYVSPFMDGLPAPSGWLTPPITFVGLVFWITLLALSIGLRRRFPALLFGVLFFLTGHLLESTVIGLELYFAHRNYVSSFGIYFILVFALSIVPDFYRKAAIAAVSVYCILFAFVLSQTTSLWNLPQFAAEQWRIANPHSERAVQFAAIQAINRGDFLLAKDIYDDASARHPDRPVLQILRTQICLGEEDHFPELLGNVTRYLKTAKFEPYAASVLAISAQADPAELCRVRDHSALAMMAESLLSNPPFLSAPLPRSELLFTMAMAKIKEGYDTQPIELLKESFYIHHHLDTAFYAASLMTNLRQYDQVKKFLADVIQHAPPNLIMRAVWQSRINDFNHLMESQRQQP